jgi:hypothetical protein
MNFYLWLCHIVRAYARLSSHLVEQIHNVIWIQSSSSSSSSYYHWCMWTTSWTRKAVERVVQIFTILYRYENMFFFSHLKRSCRRWYYYYLIWSKLISCRSLTFHRLAWSFFLNPLLMHLMTIWDNYFPFFFWCSPMAFRILRHITLWPLLVMYVYYYGPILMIATVILFHH